MVSRGGGIVVNISSVAGKIPAAENVVYAATKVRNNQHSAYYIIRPSRIPHDYLCHVKSLLVTVIRR